MEKIQLLHPEGKKAVRMDKDKYEALKASFIHCLKTKITAPFQELLSDVMEDLEKRKIRIEGKIEWNLFWVSLDMEAKKQILRDKSVSPMMYSLPK